MKLDRRARFYLVFAGIGVALSIFYFLFFQLPLGYSTLQDVFILSLYTMGWGFVVLGLLSKALVFALTRAGGASRESLRKKGLFDFFVPRFALIMLSSGVVLWLTGSFDVAVLFVLIASEVWFWLRDRKKRETTSP
ncbi:MAG TPA: hypothetical protein VLD37_03810 [Candidatus Bilamarchaeum sp.]|nr:hypothetical protein [Candidatus Bilamarchaeum sp.]